MLLKTVFYAVKALSRKPDNDKGNEAQSVDDVVVNLWFHGLSP